MPAQRFIEVALSSDGKATASVRVITMHSDDDEPRKQVGYRDELVKAIRVLRDKADESNDSAKRTAILRDVSDFTAECEKNERAVVERQLDAKLGKEQIADVIRLCDPVNGLMLTLFNAACGRKPPPLVAQPQTSELKPPTV